MTPLRKRPRPTPAPLVDPHEVRAWAIAVGLPIAKRGPIPRDVMLAYELALEAWEDS